jgi:hypothetical protein
MLKLLLGTSALLLPLLGHATGTLVTEGGGEYVGQTLGAAMDILGTPSEEHTMADKKAYVWYEFSQVEVVAATTQRAPLTVKHLGCARVAATDTSGVITSYTWKGDDCGRTRK